MHEAGPPAGLADQPSLDLRPGLPDAGHGCLAWTPSSYNQKGHRRRGLGHLFGEPRGCGAVAFRGSRFGGVPGCHSESPGSRRVLPGHSFGAPGESGFFLRGLI